MNFPDYLHFLNVFLRGKSYDNYFTILVLTSVNEGVVSVVG